jgi:hypothetical protein
MKGFNRNKFLYVLLGSVLLAFGTSGEADSDW